MMSSTRFRLGLPGQWRGYGSLIPVAGLASAAWLPKSEIYSYSLSVLLAVPGSWKWHRARHTSMLNETLTKNEIGGIPAWINTPKQCRYTGLKFDCTRLNREIFGVGSRKLSRTGVAFITPHEQNR